MQGTRKQGCKACIHIREYILYPEYAIEDEVACKLSNWKLRQLKEEKLKLLKDDIKRAVAKSTREYYISLPTTEAHHLQEGFMEWLKRYTLNWSRKFISLLAKELQVYLKWSEPLITMSSMIFAEIAPWS